MHTLTADYLIIGAGAVGMAFADMLVTETDASIIMVDSHHKPGGHWNVAYPFVTLHQPSAFYGVSSLELSNGRRDQVGLNKGLSDLASGAQVSAYFDDVMRHILLPSGQVQFFGMSDFDGTPAEAAKAGGGIFTNRLTGEKTRVNAAKIVDCTYMKTSVPSTHIPNFKIDAGVNFMPLNDLTRVKTPAEHYVVIGGGKTGIDALLWLLEHRVPAGKITWIKSRDAWLLDRANTQPSIEFFENTMGAQAAQFEAIARAQDIDDMFARLEAGGYFVRLDLDVWPAMFHGATISQAELTALRAIKNIIRMGRVTHVKDGEIMLDKGAIKTAPNTVHIDCSASALPNLDLIPVFQGPLITPQMVRSYQPVFSAALIAHAETHYGDDETQKNHICTPVPLPNGTTDYMKMTLAFMLNQNKWSSDPHLRDWMLNNRLDGFSKMVSEIGDDPEKRAILKRLRANAIPAAMKLQQFIAAL